jgi:Na+/H+ antiporter NhaC
MYVWRGVPTNIDSVLRWKDGNSYFFKGKVFWKFNDKHMRVESENPTLSAPFWMGCTSTPLVPTERNPINPTSATASGISLNPTIPRAVTFALCTVAGLFFIPRLFYAIG